jgi:hypothetical protein
MTTDEFRPGILSDHQLDVEFTSTPRWVLSLTKTGYDEVIVDISQREEPQSGSSLYLIAVVAYVRSRPPGATPHAEGAANKAEAPGTRNPAVPTKPA